MSRKKAQNSFVERCRLHSEIGLLKKQILFCKYLCTSCSRQILVSFRRVQLVSFSLLSWLRSVRFVPCRYKMRGKSIWNIWIRNKMRGKSIWNIWTRIKWEAKLTNLNWPPLMGLNLLCSVWHSQQIHPLCPARSQEQGLFRGRIWESKSEVFHDFRAWKGDEESKTSS